ncbi:uncharacterized protein LOC144732224 [Lampetra planeri]
MQRHSSNEDSSTSGEEDGAMRNREMRDDGSGRQASQPRWRVRAKGRQSDEREMAAGKVKQSRGLNMEEVMLLQRELEMEESEEEMNDGTPRWASVFYDAALPLAMYAVLLAAFVLETLWNVISGSKS